MKNIEKQLIKLYKKYRNLADEEIGTKGIRNNEKHWFYQGRAEAMWEVIDIIRREQVNED